MLVAALVVGAVGVVIRGHHPEPTGAVAPAAEPSRPADIPSAGRSSAVSLPGSVALSIIPAPLPDETATGGSTAGQLTIVDPPPGTHPVPAAVSPGSEGLPGVLLAAYQHAEQVLGLAQPGCRLHWSLLAAVGRAESGNARDGKVGASGHTIGRILGPRLDGSPGLARVPDTDRGQLDGDPVFDRAVGPMQLLPSTWRRYAADGDGDGRMQPDDVFDAALTAGRYLCAGGADLAEGGQLGTAVFRYRPSTSYVTAVRGWAADYARGAARVPLLAPVPQAPVVLPPPGGTGDPAVAPPVAAAPPPAPSAPDPAPAARPRANRPAPAARRPPASEAVAPVPSARRPATPAPSTRRPVHIDPARSAPGPRTDARRGPAPSADAAPTSLMPVIRSAPNGRATAPQRTPPMREQMPGSTGDPAERRNSTGAPNAAPAQTQPPAQTQGPGQGRYPGQGQYPRRSPAGSTDPGPGYVYIIPENRAANAGALAPNSGAAPSPGANQPGANQPGANQPGANQRWGHDATRW